MLVVCRSRWAAIALLTQLGVPYSALTERERMLRVRVRQSPWMANHFDLRHQFALKDPGMSGRVSVRDLQEVCLQSTQTL